MNMEKEEKGHNSADTALLVMDIQAGTISRLGDSAPVLLEKLNGAIAAARKAGMPVIYVVVGFRKNFPEISLHNRSFGALKQGGSIYKALEEPIVIDPAVSPQEGDVVITKRRVSAFTGSDLEVVLRSFQVKHLVLSGISTSGVVLSTLREAADKDYRLTVLSDGCADPDPEVHTVLLTKVFPRQADVVTAAEWAAKV
jgi:nicotinamidase-related amidase